MRRVIVVLAILSVLAGCTRHVAVTPVPGSNQPESSAPSSEGLTQDSGAVTPSQTSHEQAPVTVALDYLGVRNTHWLSQVGGEAHARVQFVIVVSDETGVLEACTIPPEGIPGLEMDYFQVKPVKDYLSPEVYSGPVAEALTIYVAAYNVNKGPITKAQMDIVSQWMDMPGLTALKAMVPDKELIGYYFYTWSPQDDWGLGRHDEQGDGDLRVWYRIGNGQMPEPAKTPVLRPNVTIDNVKLPTDVVVRQPYSEAYVLTTYPFEFTIRNNESFDLPVYWRLTSTQPPQSDSEDNVRTFEDRVIVSGNSETTIHRDYWFSVPGAYDWQYVLESPEGNIVDSWAGTLNVQAVKGGLPELPSGTYEAEVGYSLWPATSGATVVWERYLSAGEKVQATVEWLGNQAVAYDWRFRVWGPAESAAPTSNVAYTWSGRDLKKSFNFTSSSDGIYRIEILKRDYTARALRLTVNPEEWETWPD